jgi:hypothetical protein
MPGNPATNNTSGYTGGVYAPINSGFDQWSAAHPGYGGSPGQPYPSSEFMNKDAGLKAYNDAANTPYQQTNPWLQAAGAGAMQGQAALSGDTAAMQNYMNPYQNQVLDQMNSQWGRLSHNVTNSINDQATQAGAFGGSRQGVAEGVGQGELANNMANQMSNLTYSGFQNAQNLAGQQAAGLQGLGQYANSQANAATAWKPTMMSAGFNAYPEMTMQGQQGTSQPSGANQAAKAGGTAMQMLPLLAMFA